jgi:hypothetical protein
MAITHTWESLARSSLHPVQARIVMRMQASPDLDWSPSKLAADDEFEDLTLGAVAYHVRLLRDIGYLRKAREVRVRGAIETYYKLFATPRVRVRA